MFNSSRQVRNIAAITAIVCLVIILANLKDELQAWQQVGPLEQKYTGRIISIEQRLAKLRSADEKNKQRLRALQDAERRLQDVKQRDGRTICIGFQARLNFLSRQQEALDRTEAACQRAENGL